MMETVTYVEMTALSDLVPAEPVAGLTLDPVDRGEPLIPGILARIGAPHGWRSASRTAPEWAAWFAAYPDRLFWLLSFNGEPAGMLTYDRPPRLPHVQDGAGRTRPHGRLVQRNRLVSPAPAVNKGTSSV
jgi:hypothetical protein